MEMYCGIHRKIIHFCTSLEISEAKRSSFYVVQECILCVVSSRYRNKVELKIKIVIHGLSYISSNIPFTQYVHCE